MEMWTLLPGWFRYSVSLALVVAGILIFLFTNPVPLTIVGTLIGLGVALGFIGPSRSEKKGYRF